MNRISVGLAVLLAIGCGDPEPVIDTGTGEDAGTPVDTGGGDTPRTDAPIVTGDGNDTFATATPAELGVATGGGIATAGDLDYYSFTGTAGDWIQITTTANADDDPMMIDTVVTLYDSSMTMIAENDDSLPRANTDSELTTRLPSTGTYYVLVQEWSTWAGETDEFGAAFLYQLGIANLTPDTVSDAVTFDDEAGDTVAEAQPLNTIAIGTSGNFYGIALATLEDATDVDVYSFTIGAGASRNFSVDIIPAGPAANGSTATPAHIWITNADGSEIIARIAPEAAPAAGTTDSVDPSLPAGDYNLFVEHGGTAGANDFYVLKIFNLGDNPPEDSEAANDMIETPEDIDVADDGEGGRRGFVLATMGTGDVDHYAFSALESEISVSCGSRSSGSGVLGLTVALLDAADGSVLMSSTETDSMNAFIDAFAADGGDYIVRLSTTGQDPVVTGNWVRCGIYVAPPTATP